MIIEYTKETNYSIDLSKAAERRLAKHLGITVKQMHDLADEGDLATDHGEAIYEWTTKLPEADVEETEDPDTPYLEITI